MLRCVSSYGFHLLQGSARLVCAAGLALRAPLVTDDRRPGRHTSVDHFPASESHIGLTFFWKTCVFRVFWTYLGGYSSEGFGSAENPPLHPPVSWGDNGPGAADPTLLAQKGAEESDFEISYLGLLASFMRCAR